jgi:hypothetical protein
MTSKTKTIVLFLTSVAVVGLGSRTAFAQTTPAPAATPKPATLGLAVYPGKGQDAAQQSKDEGECYTWARQQTGIDPTAAPTPVAAAEAPKGGAVKGAARGAARGAAVGAVGDDDRVRDEGNLDAGEGAAAGAAAGAAKGRRAQKKAGKQAEAQAKQATQAQDAASKDTFKKSWGACLEGRGYSVK